MKRFYYVGIFIAVVFSAMLFFSKTSYATNYVPVAETNGWGTIYYDSDRYTDIVSVVFHSQYINSNYGNDNARIVALLSDGTMKELHIYHSTSNGIVLWNPSTYITSWQSKIVKSGVSYYIPYNQSTSYFPSLSDFSYPDYDENIGQSLTISLYKTKVTDTFQRWSIQWKSSTNNGQYDYDSVHIVIKGDTVIETDVFQTSGVYWFTPSDVFNDVNALGNPVRIYVTPYLSGDWGATKFIDEIYSPSILNTILSPFVDFVRSFVVDDTTVIGVDDTTVVTIPDKPDSSGNVPTTSTTISTVTTYSPVFNSTSESTVTNIIDNGTYTTNNYYETINNIDNSTTISISINVSEGERENALTRYNSAKEYLETGPDTVLSTISILDGSPFQPIFTAFVTGFVILIGAALVFVIVKIVGLIL